MTGEAGDVGPGPDEMLAPRPGDDLIDLHLSLCGSAVRLAAAAGEGVEDDEPRQVVLRAARRLGLVIDPYRELIHQARRKDAAVGEVDLVFAARRVGADLGQVVAADAVIARRFGAELIAQ